jgi:hypothetical protein
MMFQQYTGNRPANINREAKYAVIHAEGDMLIRAIMPIDRTERVILTTEAHPGLVDMVNAVKLDKSGAPGGAFYITEYRLVIVPDIRAEYWVAGKYHRDLVFDFDGIPVGPRAPEGLEPGDPWPGPRVGIPYALAAGGRDIYYELQEGNRIRRIRLSEISEQGALFLAERLAVIKGGAGGVVRINEAREFFAPAPDPANPLYLGSLEDDCWFPPE